MGTTEELLFGLVWRSGSVRHMGWLWWPWKWVVRSPFKRTRCKECSAASSLWMHSSVHSEATVPQPMTEMRGYWSWAVSALLWWAILALELSTGLAATSSELYYSWRFPLPNSPSSFLLSPMLDLHHSLKALPVYSCFLAPCILHGLCPQ